MRETWYVLESGQAVDPREVVSDAAGLLRHKSGPVAYRNGVPSSRGVDLAEEPGKARDLKPAAKAGGYKTRESKAG